MTAFGPKRTFAAMRGKTLALLSILFASGIFVACSEKPSEQGPWGGVAEAKARATKGKNLFEEKCRTVSGEKIYRTIPNIEGIELLKIRPRVRAAAWADPAWPGAAFADESASMEYIESFLGYETPLFKQDGTPIPLTAKNRGLVGKNYRSDGVRGYRYADVIDENDGQRYRYVLEQRPVPDSKIGTKQGVVERSRSSGPAPRYGVTFEDHVIPEERALGLASSTVKVIDLQTKEVLGELIRYVWSPAGPSPANPLPWLTAQKCPVHPVGVHSSTRQFVDQVLLPKREK